MHDEFENEELPLEDQQAENEIKKIKLALEHGMDLSKSFANSDLPPEVEGQFLDYIQQWEDAFAERKMIQVFDLAGKPECKPVAEIADADIDNELAAITKILRDNGIAIESICDVNSRELYRFITEEMFKMETNDIRIPGMIHGFIYEEYHPNHEYDIKNRCTELVDCVLDRASDTKIGTWSLGDSVFRGGEEISKDELNKKLINFRESFSEFIRHEFEYAKVELSADNTEARAVAKIRYSAVIDGTVESLDYSGECVFNLKCDSGWWVVTQFEIPGIVL